jgi:hypothetical protein
MLGFIKIPNAVLNLSSFNFQKGNSYSLVSRRQPCFILIASVYTLLSISSTYASPYEVLVVGIAKQDEVEKILEYEEDAREFNALHREGYLAAKPYFDVLHMTDGQVYFVFGFRGAVQGIHRENYHRTVKNLRRLKNGSVPKYPNMIWVPVEEIRRRMAEP